MRGVRQFAACLLLSAACGDDGGAMQGPTPLPAEVDAVLERNCRPCHTDPPERFAPMPLVTWEDTQAPAPSDAARAVFEVIADRIHSEKFPMPPVREPPMPSRDRDVLDAWIADGAPPGS